MKKMFVNLEDMNEYMWCVVCIDVFVCVCVCVRVSNFNVYTQQRIIKNVCARQNYTHILTYALAYIFQYVYMYALEKHMHI